MLDLDISDFEILIAALFTKLARSHRIQSWHEAKNDSYKNDLCTICPEVFLFPTSWRGFHFPTIRREVLNRSVRRASEITFTNFTILFLLKIGKTSNLWLHILDIPKLKLS